MKTKDFSNSRSDDQRTRAGRFVCSCAIAALLMLPTAAGTAQEFEYTINGHGVTITKYTGAGGEVIIEKIQGKPVTSIGAGAFLNCTTLTGVSIPEGVDSIGNSAFEGCSSLLNVALPDTLTSLGARAFFGCVSLPSVTLAGSITQWPEVTSGTYPNTISGSWVFADCTNLTIVTIGDGLDTIPPYAFSGCINLNSILIPASVTRIGNGAFDSCRSLAGVTVPESVTSMGAYAFSRCTSLVSISLPGTITEWPVITNYQWFPPGWGLPEYIPTSGSWVFANCTNLTAVIVGEGISTIPSYGFSDCVRLGAVLLPNSVSSIGPCAFQNCHSLTSVSIPNGVTRLGASAFAGCTSLASITIPGSVTDWQLSDSWFSAGRAYTFSGCTNLTSVTIEEAVPAIPSYAFSSCVRLASISIPNSVTNIASDAFVGCSSLSAVNVDALNPAYSSAEGVLLNKNQTTLIKCPQGLTGTCTIPDGVTGIASAAFDACVGLTSVRIPNTVSSIGNGAFQGCSSLTGVMLPKGLTSLGACAFSGCTSLTSMTIPGSVHDWAVTTFTWITVSPPIIPLVKSGFVAGAWTFAGCTNLRTVMIENGVTNIPAGAFSGIWMLGLGGAAGCSGLTRITIPPSVTSLGTAVAADSATGVPTIFSGTNLTGIYFEGNAPRLLSGLVDSPSATTVYYLPGAVGWSGSYGNRPTAPWVLPHPVILNSGVHGIVFGFIISWATNVPVVVEGSTTPTDSNWFPLSTNTLVNGSSYFADIEWTWHSRRFYRIRGL